MIYVSKGKIPSWMMTTIRPVPQSFPCTRPNPRTGNIQAAGERKMSMTNLVGDVYLPIQPAAADVSYNVTSYQLLGSNINPVTSAS